MNKKIEIPQGSTQKAINERRKILKSKLTPLAGKVVYSPNLEAKIHITKGSVKEICQHAAKGKESTKEALNIREHIKNCKFYAYRKIKRDSKNQSKYIIMIEAHNTYNGGSAKLTIGVKVINQKERLMQYCITAIQ